MPRPDPKIHIVLPISKIVPVISNDGGYLGRECLYCGATGWEGEDADYGKHHAQKSDKAGLRHKTQCVLNQYIDRNTGRIIPPKGK